MNGNVILLADEAIDTVMKEFKCPICLGLLKNAVVLECCHNRFCKICISTYLHQVGLKLGQKRHCPMCKHETTHRKLKHDTTINNLISTLKSMSHPTATEADNEEDVLGVIRTANSTHLRRFNDIIELQRRKKRSRMGHSTSRAAKGPQHKTARSSNEVSSSASNQPVAQTLLVAHTLPRFVEFTVAPHPRSPPSLASAVLGGACSPSSTSRQSMLSSVSFKLRDSMTVSEFLSLLEMNTWAHSNRASDGAARGTGCRAEDLQLFIPGDSSTMYWQLTNIEATFGQVTDWCRDNGLAQKLVVGATNWSH